MKIIKLIIDGKEVEIPSGGGSTPVGTVISFLGMSAPDGYLVCDGAEYEIAVYPALADLFRQQFGTANHFGGNGTDTFCVPDMRNLFLRGYHGEAEEQLSAPVGQKQEATEIPNVYSLSASKGILEWVKENRQSNNAPKHVDRKIRGATRVDYAEPSGEYVLSGEFQALVGYEYYSTRPANMAVLYCIKAV